MSVENTKERLVELKILNLKWGQYSIGKILKETEKAYLIRGFHSRKYGFYKAHWIPKQFVRIIQELQHCSIHDRFYSEFCFDCVKLVREVVSEHE